MVDMVGDRMSCELKHNLEKSKYKDLFTRNVFLARVRYYHHY